MLSSRPDRTVSGYDYELWLPAHDQTNQNSSRGERGDLQVLSLKVEKLIAACGGRIVLFGGRSSGMSPHSRTYRWAALIGFSA